MKLTPIAQNVLPKRYLRKKADGTLETPQEMLRRVAVALAEGNTEAEAEFYALMDKQDFLPNSPTFTGAGTNLGQLSACFVLPVGDSLSEIYGTMSHAALIHQSGGGTGFAFSRLRPEGDSVRSSQGVASGPLSFMAVYNGSTEAIKQGGTRRGANMGILRVDHPDILKFIRAKNDLNALTNFNLSVGITDTFMEALAKKGTFDLINPRNGEVVGQLEAETVWNELVECAWRTGEPGVVFIDRMNRRNPNNHCEVIEATNPCGEQPLPPYGSCNLGSINLANFVNNPYTLAAEIDWERLGHVTEAAVRMLNAVIDVNKYPLEEIAKKAMRDRRIGLGVMGWAEMLVQLLIPYDSLYAVQMADQLMTRIKQSALHASMILAQECGAYHEWEGSQWQQAGIKIRNATLTTVAPTGTISLMAAQSEHPAHELKVEAPEVTVTFLGMPCTGGIEPKFALVFTRNQAGAVMVDVDQQFEYVARKEGWYSETLMKKVAEHGTVRGVEGVPEQWQRIFATAHDVLPTWHVRMQSAFQGTDDMGMDQPVDAAVSKTCNFPNNATKSDVRTVYDLAWSLGLKGITVYRDGCRAHQVLTSGTKQDAPAASSAKKGTLDAEYVQEVAGEMADAIRDGGQIGAEVVEMWSKQLQAATTASGAAPKSVPVSTPVVSGPMLRPRPDEANGKMFKVPTHFGNLTLDVHMDDRGAPFEIIVNVGAAGSDLMADATAIGMLASKMLRLRSDVSPDQRISIIIDTLKHIGGSSSYGFGPNKVTSLASAMAQALIRFQNWQDTKRNGDVPEPVVQPMAGGSMGVHIHDGGEADFREPCPECGGHSLVFSEGCKHCAAGCGYSACG